MRRHGGSVVPTISWCPHPRHSGASGARARNPKRRRREDRTALPAASSGCLGGSGFRAPLARPRNDGEGDGTRGKGNHPRAPRQQWISFRPCGPAIATPDASIVVWMLTRCHPRQFLGSRAVLGALPRQRHAASRRPGSMLSMPYWISGCTRPGSSRLPIETVIRSCSK